MDCPDSVRRVHLLLGVLQIVGAEAVKRADAGGKPRSTDWLKSNVDSGATYMQQLREAARDCREAINRTLGLGWMERLIADCDLCVQIAERAADPPATDGQPIGEFLHNMTDLPAEWAPINGRLTERRSTLLQIVAGDVALESMPESVAASMKNVAPVEMSLQAKALALLNDHSDWTDEQIAAALGCARTSLYRFDDYKAAKKILRRPATVVRGSKDKNSGRMEAWEDD